MRAPTTRFKDEIPGCYRKVNSQMAQVIVNSERDDPVTKSKPTFSMAIVQDPKPTIKALRAPKVPVARTRSTRPSLSEQLASIGSKADAISRDIAGKYGIETGGKSVSFSTPSLKFTVGRLECKYPSPVAFDSEKCMYTFQHPFASKEIRMYMYFRDMRKVSVRNTTLSFKIMKHLEQFGDDYVISNPQHMVQIIFASRTDADRVRQHCKAKLKQCSNRCSSNFNRFEY